MFFMSSLTLIILWFITKINVLLSFHTPALKLKEYCISVWISDNFCYLIILLRSHQYLLYYIIKSTYLTQSFRDITLRSELTHFTTVNLIINFYSSHFIIHLQLQFSGDPTLRSKFTNFTTINLIH